MHRTRNAAYGQPYRGFESLPLRQRLRKLMISLTEFGGADETPDLTPDPAHKTATVRSRLSPALAANDGKATRRKRPEPNSGSVIDPRSRPRDDIAGRRVDDIRRRGRVEAREDDRAS